MTAASLIGGFGFLVNLHRYEDAGTYVNGDYVAVAPTISQVIMSIQPISGRELLNVPEAQRTRQFMTAYSPVKLYTVQTSVSKKADLIEWDGAFFEVQAVEYWASSGNSIAPHWRCRIAEVNVL
jgi:hypothetical protein